MAATYQQQRPVSQQGRRPATATAVPTASGTKARKAAAAAASSLRRPKSSHSNASSTQSRTSFTSFRSQGSGGAESQQSSGSSFGGVRRPSSLEELQPFDYELVVRQQPKHAKICTGNDKQPKGPIDPPPVVRLQISRAAPAGTGEEHKHSPGSKDPQQDGDDSPASSQTTQPTLTSASLIQSPYLFCFAALCRSGNDEELYLQEDGKSRFVSGNTVSSLYHLRDPQDGSAEGFFVFPDIGVRVEGTFRLKLSLYEMVDTTVHHCKTVYTDVFHVYSAKRFPGLEDSTELSKSFASQGLKIRIKGGAARTAGKNIEVASQRPATADASKRPPKSALSSAKQEDSASAQDAGSSGLKRPHTAAAEFGGENGTSKRRQVVKPMDLSPARSRGSVQFEPVERRPHTSIDSRRQEPAHHQLQRLHTTQRPYNGHSAVSTRPGDAPFDADCRLSSSSSSSGGGGYPVGAPLGRPPHPSEYPGPPYTTFPTRQPNEPYHASSLSSREYVQHELVAYRGISPPRPANTLRPITAPDDWRSSSRYLGDENGPEQLRDRDHNLSGYDTRRDGLPYRQTAYADPAQQRDPPYHSRMPEVDAYGPGSAGGSHQTGRPDRASRPMTGPPSRGHPQDPPFLHPPSSSSSTASASSSPAGAQASFRFQRPSTAGGKLVLPSLAEVVSGEEGGSATPSAYHGGSYGQRSGGRSAHLPRPSSASHYWSTDPTSVDSSSSTRPLLHSDQPYGRPDPRASRPFDASRGEDLAQHNAGMPTSREDEERVYAKYKRLREAETETNSEEDARYFQSRASSGQAKSGRRLSWQDEQVEPRG